MTRSSWFWLIIACICVAFVYAVRDVLPPFVVGVLAAYMLDPVASRLEARGLSRGGSSALIVGGLFVIFLILCLSLPPVIVAQAAGFLESLPAYMASLEARYSDTVFQWIGVLENDSIINSEQAVANASGMMISFAQEFLLGLLQSGLFVFHVLGLLIITPVVTFYLLRDWRTLVARVDGLLPTRYAPVIREEMSRVDDTLAGFMRGQLNVCLLMAAYYGLSLSLCGLQFGLAIGVMTGMLVIVPYLGFALGFAVGMTVAFFQFDPLWSAWPVLAAFTLGQALESYWLTPKLVGEKVGLDPLWIIFALLAGGALFGFVGVLLAVPVAAVAGVGVRFLLRRYHQIQHG